MTPKNSSDSTPDADKAARRARLLNLDAALAAAHQLSALVRSSFPEAAAMVDASAGSNLNNLTVAKKLALGERNAGELAELAFNLDPNAAIESLESTLSSDASSQAAAASAIFKAQGPTSKR